MWLAVLVGVTAIAGAAAGLWLRRPSAELPPATARQIRRAQRRQRADLRKALGR